MHMLSLNIKIFYKFLNLTYDFILEMKNEFFPPVLSSLITNYVFLVVQYIMEDFLPYIKAI